MAKRTSNGKLKATTRARRYETLNELQAAVREACIDEVRRLAGNAVSVPDILAFVDAAARVDVRPRQVWRALMKALLDAKEIALTPPEPSPFSNPYDGMLRDIAVQPGVIMYATVFGEVLERDLAADATARGPEDLPTTRALLVRRFAKPGLLWWEERRPKDREIALLTLLAGEWPEHASRQLSQAVEAEIKLSQPTVAAVIQAEARAVERIRARLAEPAAKHSSSG